LFFFFFSFFLQASKCVIGVQGVNPAPLTEPQEFSFQTEKRARSKPSEEIEEQEIQKPKKVKVSTIIYYSLLLTSFFSERKRFNYP